MKRSYKKVFDQPFIKGFVRFYQSAESDITSIAGSLLFVDLHFPFDADCSQYLALLSHSSHSDSLSLEEVLPASLYRTVAQMISSVLTKPSTGLLSFSDYFCFVDLLSEHCLPPKSL